MSIQKELYLYTKIDVKHLLFLIESDLNSHASQREPDVLTGFITGRGHFNNIRYANDIINDWFKMKTERILT